MTTRKHQVLSATYGLFESFSKQDLKLLSQTYIQSAQLERNTYFVHELHQGQRVKVTVRGAVLVTVLNALSTATYDGFHTTIGYTLLAKYTGYSRSTLIRAVTVLRRMGFLFVKHNYTSSPQPKRVASTYCLQRFRDWVIHKALAALQSKQTSSISSIAEPQLFIFNKTHAKVSTLSYLWNTLKRKIGQVMIIDKDTGELFTT